MAMANGTPLQKVYDAFLTRISSDEWTLPEELDIAKRDWRMLLDIAIFRFRFPRIALDILDAPEADGELQEALDEYFVNNITQREIQVLATYMKHEWVRRCIASWEEVKMLYSNKDFSQANHLDKLIKASDQIEKECNKNAATYSRSIDSQPFDFTQFAGGVIIDDT
jgi:hypothetical protein